MKDYAKRIHTKIESFLEFLDDLSELINPPAPEKFDVNEQVRSVVYSAKRSSLISVIEKFGNISPEIIGYKRQFSQIVRVIVFNAINAMDGEGILTLSTQEITKKGMNYVEITISDTGKGIPEDIQPIIFTPGRVKSNKRGFGMGLPWSSLVLRITGGDIYFDTIIGKGTSMKVLVPRDSREFTIEGFGKAGE